MEELGTVIKNLRKKHYEGSQSDFAGEVGISQTSMSQIECNRATPSKDTLKKISYYLNVPLPVIFWSMLSEDDVEEDKRDIFRSFKPVVEEFLASLFVPD